MVSHLTTSITTQSKKIYEESPSSNIMLTK